MKITRTLTVAAAAVAAIALSACEAPESATTAGSPSSTAAAAQNATQAPESATVERAAEESSSPKVDLDAIAERAFLSTVSEHQSPSDEAALMVGRATCSLLDQGSTPDTLAYELLLADGPVVPGFSNDELPFFYGAAMGSLCPEYGERFFG